MKFRIAIVALLAAGCQSLPLLSHPAAATPVDPFALYRQHDYAAAEAAFNQPSSVDAVLARADCQRHLHQTADEFASLKQAARLFPQAPAAWIALADYETRAGRLDHADLALRRALAVDPSNKDAWCAEGLLRLRQHRTDDALVCFNRAAGSADVASISP